MSWAPHEGKADFDFGKGKGRVRYGYEFLCDHCGHGALRHAQRMGDSDLSPCLDCQCEDFESEAADENRPPHSELEPDPERVIAKLYRRFEIATAALEAIADYPDVSASDIARRALSELDLRS